LQFLQEIVGDGFERLRLICRIGPLESLPRATHFADQYENATASVKGTWEDVFEHQGKASEDLSLLTSSCFESLDQAFCESFYDPAKKGVEPPEWLFSCDSRYQGAMAIYRGKVVKALNANLIVTGGARETILSRACFALLWNSENPPLPLMTISFLRAIRQILGKSQRVIEEASIP
jgi:hypothetical protein